MSDPTDIYAWLRLDDRLTTSGQPTEQQLVSLQELGVSYVINLGLHTHERALTDERASVEALGMTYIHIPVEFDAPKKADFELFRVAPERVGDASVHVHCIVNARVSAFIYRFRLSQPGFSEARARQDLERIWRPGGVWAAFLGDEASIDLPHRPGLRSE